MKVRLFDLAWWTFIVCVLIFAYACVREETARCKAAGGVLVRGAIGNECVRGLEPVQ